jgi:hypothetical protein
MESGMPALHYGKYVLISRPLHDAIFYIWTPYASVSWNKEKEFRYHQIKDLDKTFDTQEEAIAFGFIVARIWADEQKSD